MTKSVQVTIRVEPEVVEQADELAEILAKAALPGMEPTRAGVLRSALIRGLAALRADVKPKRR